MIGISAGLLALNTPFGFLALLGAMSLAGLTFGTVLTMVMVPTFYATFYGIRATDDGLPAESAAVGTAAT